MIELGLCYHTGRWTERDRGRARALWLQAERLGSREAAVRLAVVDVAGEGELQNADSTIALLGQAIDEGSVLAEVGLAYCYERGRGVEARFDEAVRLYRSGYRRGSQDAYRALRRLHDAIRPADDRFRVPD
jgi:TPR repeat protein